MSTLQDSIDTLTAILNRNDLTPALATTFIQQAQTRIERKLRVPGMETIGAISGSSTSATDQIIIPSDFLALKLLYTQGPSGGLDLISFKDVSHFFMEQKRGGGVIPRFYTRIGGSFLITRSSSRVTKSGWLTTHPSHNSSIPQTRTSGPSPVRTF